MWYIWTAIQSAGISRSLQRRVAVGRVSHFNLTSGAGHGQLCGRMVIQQRLHPGDTLRRAKFLNVLGGLTPPYLPHCNCFPVLSNACHAVLHSSHRTLAALRPRQSMEMVVKPVQLRASSLGFIPVLRRRRLQCRRVRLR